MPLEDEEEVDVSKEMSQIASLINKTGADDDDDDDGDEFVIGAKIDDDDDDGGKDRKTKRKERGELWRANQGLAQENGDLRERLARLEGMADSIHPRAIQEVLLGRGQQQQHVPDTSEEDALKKERDMLLRSYGAAVKAGITPEDEEAYRRKADELEERRWEAWARRKGLAAQGDPQQIAQAQLAAQIKMQNRARHPDVYGSPRATKWAGGLWNQLVTEYSGPDGSLTVDPQALHDHCMDKARERFGMKPRNERLSGPESQAQRKRHSGSSRGGAPTRGDSGGRSFRMTDMYKAMADEAFSHITDERKRHQEWVNRVGKHL